MPGAYPVDLRARAVAALRAGLGSRAEIGQMFGVGEASISRWSSLERKNGSLEPAKRSSRGSKLVTPEGLEFIRQTLEALPDSTIMELVAAYTEEFDVTMSRATMSRTVNETLGFTRKKGVFARQPR